MRSYIYILISILLYVGCSSANYRTVKVVKPVNRNRYYVRGKDKRKKRTKIVKRKVLVKSPKVPVAKSKPPKKKKEVAEDQVQSDSTQMAQPPLPGNEPDSTRNN